MNNIMNDTVNDRKGHNIVNDSFAHEPDGLLVILFYKVDDRSRIAFKPLAIPHYVEALDAHNM